MRQWAIVVGLDDYQFFQSLTCAQQDAQALHQFLIDEVGFPPEQCLLFTNSSPQIWGRSTSLTRVNFLDWIDLLAQKCFQPGDLLWFFFSGYGVCSQGKDYLVPTDGDPFAVETTCIPVASILSRLQVTLPVGMPLALLDISRSQGTFSNENVGIQTAQLAKQLAIPTILSCQPGQFSREVSSLGYGLFTAALLEGLRYHQGATPATLMQFLSSRLPELCEHYWQPTQHPLNICPGDKLHQPLLSSFSAYVEEAGANTVASDFTADFSNGRGAQAAIEREPHRHTSAAYHAPPTAATPVESATPLNGAGNSDPRRSEIAAKLAADPFHLTPTPPIDQPNLNPYSRVEVTPPLTNSRSTPPPAAADNPVADRRSQPLPVEVVTSKIDRLPPPPSPPTESHQKTTSEAALETALETGLWRPILLWGGLLSLGLIGCVLWRNWSSLWSPQTTVTPPAVPTSAPPAPAPLPPQTSPANPETLRSTSATTGNPAVVSPSPNQPLNFNPTPAPNQSTGQVILENARRQVLSDQATPYRNAIDEARKIQANDPMYGEAQQDIANWSQKIFTIAQQRANLKQWDIAIMAADLVPADHPQLRPQALAAIDQWCPAISNQPVQTFPMRQAKAVCSNQPI